MKSAYPDLTVLKIGEPFFKSLSEFSSDPRRRAEAPVVTYSALSFRNLAPRPFHQEDQPTVVPGRLKMEVYAASRRDLANAIQSYNDNDSITFISGAKVRRKLVLYPFFTPKLDIISTFHVKMSSQLDITSTFT